jgi:hypothetical protein
MVSKNPGLISANRLSPILKSHDLVQLAKDAGIKLCGPETRLLAWVSEVVIWKARYLVPTNPKFAFFHRLDNIDLADAIACIKALEGISARTKKMLPRPKRVSEGFDALVSDGKSNTCAFKSGASEILELQRDRDLHGLGRSLTWTVARQNR